MKMQHHDDAATQATEGIRTLDLTFTKRLLCRLSYGGIRIGGAHYKWDTWELQGKCLYSRGCTHLLGVGGR